MKTNIKITLSTDDILDALEEYINNQLAEEGYKNISVSIKFEDLFCTYLNSSDGKLEKIPKGFSIFIENDL